MSELPVTTCLFVPHRGDTFCFYLKTDTPMGVGPLRLPPGGKVERGTTPDGNGGLIPADRSLQDAAIREAMEEAGIKPIPTSMILLAVMEYIHTDKPERNRRTFWFVGSFEGEPVVTEAHFLDPQFYPINGLPLEAMWPVERQWLQDALMACHRATYTPVRLRVTYTGGQVQSTEPFRGFRDPLPIFADQSDQQSDFDFE